MTDEQDPSIPIDAYPDPVVTYEWVDDEIVVTASNGTFDATFGSVEAGTPLADLVTVSSEDDKTLEQAVSDAETTFIARVGIEHREVRTCCTVESGWSGFLVIREGAGDTAESAVSVGDVASVISHDLRNPIDVAKAHLRAARETGDAEHFEAVANAHDRMEEIIEDVLTLARGSQALDPSPSVSVGGAVEDAWGSVETDDATLEMTDGLPETAADPERLRRLFENLFRNSIEHAVPDGSLGQERSPGIGASGRAVTVRVGSLDDGFYVADDGQGIPANERDAVLEPGYTVEDGGTGLGLAIVDRIVDAHGWDLTLTNERDGGARFEISF
ncbi:sensor histidine kinase [Halorhabdus salina]|uniref:sensor histidine kinase n=1 Tax=Halorhabdus salina TaxID=2750670 RepID=UPI0015EF1638|nr:HAMP domain-containing sensor histidine kinase [Halorhabdus salina]